MAKHMNWKQRLAEDTSLRLTGDFPRILQDDYGIIPRETFVPKTGKSARIVSVAAGTVACAAVIAFVLALTGLPWRGGGLPVAPGPDPRKATGAATVPASPASPVLIGRIREMQGQALLIECCSGTLSGTPVLVGGKIDIDGFTVGDYVEVTYTGEVRETYPVGITAIGMRKLPSYNQTAQSAAPSSQALATTRATSKSTSVTENTQTQAVVERSFTAIVLEDGQADSLVVCGDFGQPIVQECDFTVTAPTDLRQFKAGNRVQIFYTGELADPAPQTLTVDARRVERLEEHVFTAWVLDTFDNQGRSMIVNDRRSDARIQITCGQDLGDLPPGSYVRIVYDGRMASSYPAQVRAQRVDVLERASGERIAKELRAEVVKVLDPQLAVRSLDATYTDITFVTADTDLSVYAVGDKILIRYQGYKTAGAPLSVVADSIAPLTE